MITRKLLFSLEPIFRKFQGYHFLPHTSKEQKWRLQMLIKMPMLNIGVIWVFMDGPRSAYLSRMKIYPVKCLPHEMRSLFHRVVAYFTGT